MNNSLLKVRIFSNAIPMAIFTMYLIYAYLVLFSGVPIQFFLVPNRLIQLLALFISTIFIYFILRDTITPPIIVCDDYIEYRLLHHPWKRVKWDGIQKLESDRLSRITTTRVSLIENNDVIRVFADSKEYLHFVEIVVNKVGRAKCDKYTLDLLDCNVRNDIERYKREKYVYIYGIWLLIIIIWILSLI